MTATNELRRLLDERGVEWTVPDESWNQDSITYWKVGSIKWVAFESENDTLWLNCNSVTDFTTAQAIAATLGSGTCRNVHEPPKDTTFWPAPHFKCSECGATHVSMEYVYFCPNCGRKVVDA